MTNTCHKSHFYQREWFSHCKLDNTGVGTNHKKPSDIDLYSIYILNANQENIKLGFRSRKSCSIIDIFEFCWCIKPKSRASLGQTRNT